MMQNSISSQNSEIAEAWWQQHLFTLVSFVYIDTNEESSDNSNGSACTMYYAPETI